MNYEFHILKNAIEIKSLIDGVHYKIVYPKDMISTVAIGKQGDSTIFVLGLKGNHLENLQITQEQCEQPLDKVYGKLLHLLGH